MGKRSTLLMGIMGVIFSPLTVWPPNTVSTEALVYEASAADSTLFFQKQKLVTADVTTAERTMAVAKSFLGAPYVLGCLDRRQEEQLTINLRELDCWTFVEISLAISLAQDGNFKSFAELLQQLRYWGGTINGYGSRIHYFTGWLLQAEQNGLIEDLSASMGGIPYKKQVGYISARPHKYPKIKDAQALTNIRHAEKRINAHQWHYIPQAKIAKMEHLIQEGDLVCLTSVKQDLDIAHQGFAVKQNGRIYLMHASSLSKRVVLSRQPLAEYVISQPGQSGIMVARFK